MRYWIYWNDLVQGPFEREELAALRAFTPDLLMCPETGHEWKQAAQIPDFRELLHLRSAKVSAESGRWQASWAWAVCLVFVILGSTFYSLMDRYSSWSAIAEAVQDQPTARHSAVR